MAAARLPDPTSRSPTSRHPCPPPGRRRRRWLTTIHWRAQQSGLHRAGCLELVDPRSADSCPWLPTLALALRRRHLALRLGGAGLCCVSGLTGRRQLLGIQHGRGPADHHHAPIRQLHGQPGVVQDQLPCARGPQHTAAEPCLCLHQALPQPPPRWCQRHSISKPPPPLSTHISSPPTHPTHSHTFQRAAVDAQGQQVSVAGQRNDERQAVVRMQQGTNSSLTKGHAGGLVRHHQRPAGRQACIGHEPAGLGSSGRCGGQGTGGQGWEALPGRRRAGGRAALCCLLGGCGTGDARRPLAQDCRTWMPAPSPPAHILPSEPRHLLCWSSSRWPSAVVSTAAGVPSMPMTMQPSGCMAIIAPCRQPACIA